MKSIYSFKKTLITVIIILSSIFCSCSEQPSSVKEVMDGVVTRLYESMDKEELNQLTNTTILNILTEQEKDVLAREYWSFDVNVPVVVSIMRHREQPVIPFWLNTKNGFSKTDLVVKNEQYTYEVWQKKFNAGRVNLGINGFDKHRPVYFVSVAPQNATDNLTLSNFFPTGQHTGILKTGAFTYHDWDELVITELPSNLEEQKLLTTIRGRAREAHLIGAFRTTPFPSSNSPDQILLTWSGNPQTTQTIQWRTSTSITDGAVRFYRKTDSNEKLFQSVEATYILMEDRLLQNDRYIHRFTAELEDLSPGQNYRYSVGSPSQNIWSEEAEFVTESAERNPFTFVYFGDTHRSPHWGKLINTVFDRHPEIAFFTIAGDMVSTGLYRDDWDHLFEYSKNVLSYRSLMPSLGNHDSQDGLGVWMFRDLFSLPQNGPADIEPERTYRFNYSNALFLSIDATLPVKSQVEWIEESLASSSATWKFAIFHFPPYMYESDYQDIRELWGSVFDRYHLDMVFSGHVHTYVRSKPINNGQPVSSPMEGTVYVTSIAIPAGDDEIPDKQYAEVYFGGGMLYQKIDIDKNRLVYRCMDLQGTIRDDLIIEK